MIELNGKQFSCPVEVAMSVIGGKWKAVILSHLHKSKEPIRFTGLLNEIHTISEKVLAEQLKELLKSGLIEKNVFAESPLRVEYNLSTQGEELAPMLEFLFKWGAKLMEKEGVPLSEIPSC